MLTPILFLYTLSLTVICIGYKRSLKIFKIMTSKHVIDWIKEKTSDVKEFLWPKKVGKDISDVPGPLSIPLIGSKWIYFWRYKMNKIHEAYKGRFIQLNTDYLMLPILQQPRLRLRSLTWNVAYGLIRCCKEFLFHLQ